MPQWTTFVGLTGVVLVLLLVLSHLTQSAFTDGEPDSGDGAGARTDPAAAESVDEATGPSPRDDAPFDSDANSIGTEHGARSVDAADSPSSASDDSNSSTPNTATEVRTGVDTDASSERRDGVVADPERRRPADRGVDPDSLSTGMVLANVAFSQGLFALVLLGAAVYTAIPASALGLEFSVDYLRTGLVWGTAAGIALYVANELAAAAATHLGFDHDEALRELLSPDSIGGWLVLLVGVLPIIAVFEEFLFRAALIGVPAAGFGVSPWLLAIGSSVAFAVGHGMQGSVGVVVTGALGFVLAAVFIVTGSFLVVVVAHYLVNALEFVVHEGFEFEWAEALERYSHR
ncbi:CPBP family intramembrane glutamic endopeptidase [Natrinema salsiterrestre]|uniref:CPBP family intramembrane metalloprotease n=1 Tax=Natrinema salsiterrestre TaxID=2950540 RepID=A0A9Q4Q094_9EURY|nr:CPBP family intramembrane glutamic endopeptidase [Natrinema salsiterrestre]MDF9745589.1 CPBP family intramembrane metalloprotease [Natrinema salsiterrestre]